MKLFRGKEKDVIILRATDEDVGICVDMIADPSKDKFTLKLFHSNKDLAFII